MNCNSFRYRAVPQFRSGPCGECHSKTGLNNLNSQKITPVDIIVSPNILHIFTIVSRTAIQCTVRLPKLKFLEDSFQLSLSASSLRVAQILNFVLKMAAVDYTSLKVPDLKKLLGDRSLPISGNKADLIARLQEDDKKPSAAGM